MAFVRLFLCIGLLSAAPVAVGASPVDHPLTSHCGALMTAHSIQALGGRQDARRLIHEFATRASYLADEAGRHLPHHGRNVGPGDLVRVGFQGENMSWPDRRGLLMLDRSVARLRQLELDLDRNFDLISVVSEVRGLEQIETYFRRHGAVVRGLDGDVSAERRARRVSLDDHVNGQSARGVAALGAGAFVWATDALDKSSGAGAVVLGLIGAAHMIRPVDNAIERARASRPLRSDRRDELERFETTVRSEARSLGLQNALVHLGFNVMVSDDLFRELRIVNDVNDLSADVLLDAEAASKPWRFVPDRRARLQVDHIFLMEDESGEPVLINVARLHRPKRHRPPPPRPRFTFSRAPGALVGSH